MNLEKLQQTLVAAARAQAPDERVPLAFEKRIMALIAARAVADRWLEWSRGLWRAAISCAAIAVICGVWAAVDREPAGANDLTQEFETTLLASVDQSDLAQ